MYRNLLHSPDQALVHLAFHCCLKDGDLQDEELNLLSNNFVAKGINKEMNFREEMRHYQSYYKNIKDETAYLQFLIETIHPQNKLALFAFCAEIILRDGNVAISEEVLLDKIAGVLYIKADENLLVQNLITELNNVEKNNAF